MKYLLAALALISVLAGCTSEPSDAYGIHQTVASQRRG